MADGGFINVVSSRCREICGVFMLFVSSFQAGADLGFFVPQSKFFWRTGRYRRWAWSRLGVVDSRRGGGWRVGAKNCLC